MSKVILYQAKNSAPELFRKLKELETISLNNYIQTAEFEFEEDENINKTLEKIFTYGNNDEEFYKNNPNARSISVSDIIEIDNKFYFCDSIGFEDITDRVISSIKTEGKKLIEMQEPEAIIVNPEDARLMDDNSFLLIMNNRGHEERYIVYSIAEFKALEILVKYLEPSDSRLLYDEDLIQDKEDKSAFQWIDSKSEGAKEGHYIKADYKMYNTKDTNFTQNLNESVEEYQDKLSITLMGKIFNQMRKDGWDGSAEKADKYFDNIIAKLTNKEKENEEPLRENTNTEKEIKNKITIDCDEDLVEILAKILDIDIEYNEDIGEYTEERGMLISDIANKDFRSYIEELNEMDQTEEVKAALSYMEKAKSSLDESKEDEIVIINEDEADYYDSLFQVELYSGAGVNMNVYNVYAFSAYDALEIVVAYCEHEAPGLLINTTEVDPEETDLIYVDATEQGASQPYYVSEMTQVIDISDKIRKE